METKVCTKCNEEKVIADFARKRGSYSSRCKKCHNEYYKSYWKNTEAYEKHKVRQRAWKQENRSKIRAEKYGITIEEFEQGISGVCNICQIKPAEVVDHDHSSGVVRGFLCQQCNLGLGLLGDSLITLSKVVTYLENGQVAKR